MSEMGSRIFSDIGLPASAHCVPFRFSAEERRKKRALRIAEKLLVRLLTQCSRLRLSPFPNRSPTKWVRFGEEKQRSEQVFALARKRVIRSLLRRGRRARRARFLTCGVVRVAGYSVVWDCNPTSLFLLKSTKRSAAAIFGRSAPSLRFMVRFGIFCCRQIHSPCFLRYHLILFLSMAHLSNFLMLD